MSPRTYCVDTQRPLPVSPTFSSITLALTHFRLRCLCFWKAPSPVLTQGLCSPLAGRPGLCAVSCCFSSTLDAGTTFSEGTSWPTRLADALPLPCLPLVSILILLKELASICNYFLFTYYLSSLVEYRFLVSKAHVCLVYLLFFQLQDDCLTDWPNCSQPQPPLHPGNLEGQGSGPSLLVCVHP